MSRIAGVILMGGRGIRLGAVAKGEVEIGEQTLRGHIERALGTDIASCALSLASPTQIPPDWDGPIILDAQTGNQRHAGQDCGGPALAILTALRWAKAQNYDAIITSPVDTPFLPSTYAAQLIAKSQTETSKPVYCRYGADIHGLHGLWPRNCLADLEALICVQKIMKIQHLHTVLGSAPLELDKATKDTFHNINTPEQLAHALIIAQNSVKTE